MADPHGGEGGGPGAALVAGNVAPEPALKSQENRKHDWKH